MNLPLVDHSEANERSGFAAFERLIHTQTDLAHYPNASAVTDRVLVYDGDHIRGAVVDPIQRSAVIVEWSRLLESGPGVFMIRGAVPIREVLDRATAVFSAIIAEQRRTGSGVGDHFAKPGANDRVWNSLEKHALADPQNFVEYYSSTPIALAAEAWLGPDSQMTAQVNRVNPGGAAQVPHRDFHLGFMSSEQATRFPPSVHRMSPHLTLQGAVAHCDMPVETGPTMYLPYSQQLHDGYVVYGQPEYQAVFAKQYVQLPLQAGDAVFFNPALMHGAGHNRTPDVLRMANLLQIASAFGRAMEFVDRHAVVTAIFPALRNAATHLDAQQREAVVRAAAEGYPFPTNLDRDPPLDGMAPPSQADLLRRALAEGWSAETLSDALSAYRARRVSSP
jgi:ectoine hydroxylase-related dioxygenase (phytanoyl-CoA dioxygenase family)